MCFNNQTYYENQPTKTKTGQVINELNLVRQSMADNIEQLLGRESKLKIIANKAETLNFDSINTLNMSTAINQREAQKRRKMMLTTGAVVLIVGF